MRRSGKPDPEILGHERVQVKKKTRVSARADVAVRQQECHAMKAHLETDVRRAGIGLGSFLLAFGVCQT